RRRPIPEFLSPARLTHSDGGGLICQRSVSPHVSPQWPGFLAHASPQMSADEGSAETMIRLSLFRALQDIALEQECSFPICRQPGLSADQSLSLVLGDRQIPAAGHDRGEP